MGLSNAGPGRTSGERGRASCWEEGGTGAERGAWKRRGECTNGGLPSEPNERLLASVPGPERALELACPMGACGVVGVPEGAGGKPVGVGASPASVESESPLRRLSSEKSLR